jgi:ribosomal protein S18 acetylase RimI-like enzyme
MAITLRPVQPKDHDFLFRVYRSTRLQEVAAWGLSATDGEAFIRQQFAARQQHYGLHYAGAEWMIIQFDAAGVGQMIAQWSKDELLLVDIALLPDYRNRGIGSHIMRDLQKQAAEKALPIRLHALGEGEIRFYERLGFRGVRTKGPHLLMEWLHGQF